MSRAFQARKQQLAGSAAQLAAALGSRGGPLPGSYLDEGGSGNQRSSIATTSGFIVRLTGMGFPSFRTVTTT